MLWLVETAVMTILLLAWGVIASTGGQRRDSGWFSTESRPVSQIVSDSITSREFYIVLVVSSLLMLVLQAALLWPVRFPRARRERGRSMWVSIALIAGCGTLLVAGGLLLLGSLTKTVFGLRLEPGSNDLVITVLAVVLVGSWLTLTPLVWRFARGRNPDDAMTGLARRLFAGGAVEAVVALPVDVLVRRKTECYCAEGSLWALTIATWLMLVTAGPLALLIALRSRRQSWWRTRCILCNYDLTGLSSAVCPECGQPIPANATQP